MSQFDVTTILKQLLYQALLAQEENKGIGSVVRSISVMLSKEDIAAAKELVAQEMSEKESK